MNGKKMSPFMCQAEGFVPYNPYSRSPAPTGSQSLVFKRTNIESRQEIIISSKDAEWSLGHSFAATDLVYVGSPDLWILAKSNAGGIPLFGMDVPCDSFRPGCPSGVLWPILTCLTSASGMNMHVQNRGEKVGHFIVRLAGNYN